MAPFEASSASHSPRFPNLRRAWKCWFDPIDISALVYFRLAFGGLMFLDVLYTFGWELKTVFIEPAFHFRYFGFSWVPILPGPWMYGLATVLLMSAIGIMAGLYYRLSAWLFTIGFTWLFFSEATHYLNHYYLVCLLAFVATVLPANRSFSLDLLRKPSLRSDVAPAWTLYLLRAQLAIVYIYGGIAKINDDWLAGEPVRTWLATRAEDSDVGPILRSEWTVGLVAYGGLLFDLSIVPLLLWRRTRIFACFLVVAFHLTNAWLFSIGVFPWLGMVLTALFLPPSTFRRVAKAISRSGSAQSEQIENLNQWGFQHRHIITAFLGTYLLWQLLMPLRHFVYPGDVSWTEEGHRFSWHMKLRSKGGQTTFYLHDRTTGAVSSVDLSSHLTARQIRKMNGHPEMTLQFAHHLARLYAAQGQTNLQIHALARVTLNARPPALLIDPNINLAAVPRCLPPTDWILPRGNSQAAPIWVRKAQPYPQTQQRQPSTRPRVEKMED